MKKKRRNTALGMALFHMPSEIGEEKLKEEIKEIQ